MMLKVTYPKQKNQPPYIVITNGFFLLFLSLRGA